MTLFECFLYLFLVKNGSYRSVKKKVTVLKFDPKNLIRLVLFLQSERIYSNYLIYLP